ncbi:MAG: hypothetical protein ACI854_001147 [Arenicella sp.]
MLSLLGWWQSDSAKIDLSPGQKAPSVSQQTLLKNSEPFDFKGYQVLPLVSFDIDAKKRYRLGRGAELAPFDMALGWGMMSDHSVLDSLSIRQTGTGLSSAATRLGSLIRLT